jgi:hypothetical protein
MSNPTRGRRVKAEPMNRQFHYHSKLCPHGRGITPNPECDFQYQYEHFLPGGFCTDAHRHTHDGRKCSCGFGHYHEERCERDHGVIGSLGSGRLYLGARYWSMLDGFHDTADPHFVPKFLALADGPLRQLHDAGLDPGEVFDLCLSVAPRDWILQISRTEIEGGRRILTKLFEWFRLVEPRLRQVVLSVSIPEQASTADHPNKSETRRPLIPADLAAMLEVVKEVREDAGRSTSQMASSDKLDRSGREIALPPFRIDASLLASLHIIEQQLQVLSEWQMRPEGKPRKPLENTFIRKFAEMARSKAGGPLDGIARALFEVTFGRSIDLTTYTRRRAELEASTASRGARGRARELLEEALANGPRLLSELLRLASEKTISRNTLYRAAEELQIEGQDSPGKTHRWSLPTRRRPTSPTRRDPKRK